MCSPTMVLVPSFPLRLSPSISSSAPTNPGNTPSTSLASMAQWPAVSLRAINQMLDFLLSLCFVRTGFDQTFKLPCYGRGFLPPLALSVTSINFKPTTVGDISSARGSLPLPPSPPLSSLSLSLPALFPVTVANPKLSRLNSAVIRGATLPQGPKAFEFLLPEGAPISLSPQVGVVPLGEVRGG